MNSREKKEAPTADGRTRRIFLVRPKFQEIAKMTEKPAGLFLTKFSGFSRFAKIRRRTVIVEASCSICQAAFRYDHVGRGRRRRTCSIECRAARLSKLNSNYRRAGRYRRKPRAKTIPKLCVVCSAAFLASDAKRQACGLGCGGILAKRAGDAGRKRNAEQRRRRVCERCGSQFVMHNPSGAARAGRTLEGRFCSRDCHAAASRKLACEEVGR
jgi:ribosomal protein S27AE